MPNQASECPLVLIVMSFVMFILSEGTVFLSPFTKNMISNTVEMMASEGTRHVMRLGAAADPSSPQPRRGLSWDRFLVIGRGHAGRGKSQRCTQYNTKQAGCKQASVY